MNPLVPFVYAATLEHLENGDVATIQSFETLFANVVQVIVALAGVVLFIMFVVSGFTFLSQAAIPKNLNRQEERSRTQSSGSLSLLLHIFSSGSSGNLPASPESQRSPLLLHPNPH